MQPAKDSMKRALILLTMLVLACTKPKTNELPREAWSVEDYAKAGLRIDKPWTADDYTTAAKVLQQEAAGHQERLPRFRGVKSGAVFEKLITDLPDDRGVPVRDRFLAHATRGEEYLRNSFARVDRANRRRDARGRRDVVDDGRIPCHVRRGRSESRGSAGRSREDA
jgi:hypothetical protein